MKKLGLIAGSGKFPLLFAQEARRQSVEVVALGLPDVTDKSLESLVDKVHYFRLGEIDKPIKTLKSAGVTQVVMAGKVQHVSLFGGVRPDLRAIKMLAGLSDKRTDTILRAVAAEFAKDGIELLSSATYLQHLLADQGVLTKRAPGAAEKADIRLGWKAAKSLAALDIGLTVVAKDGAVIAVEAMEGTDACIRRASALARAHKENPSLVVVKVAKPNQDLRFDLPVLGLDTLDVLKDANVGVLALEAKTCLIFDKDEFVKRADAQRLAVIAYGAEGP